MSVRIFAGIMFVAAIMLGVLLLRTYKKNKSGVPLMIISVAIAILFCLSMYKIKTQEWVMEDKPFSTVTDENHIKIELYRSRREWLFLYEDNKVDRKIVVPPGTPKEYYETYLED